MIDLGKDEKCEFMHLHVDAVEKVRGSLPDEEKQYELAELFSMFADTTRIRIPVSYTHLDVYKRQLHWRDTRIISRAAWVSMAMGFSVSTFFPAFRAAMAMGAWR